jgi:quercetin dioxygenase-like cupin family protein
MGGSVMVGNWYSGNASVDAGERNGWLLGHFIDPSEGVRSTTDVEVKWGIHPAGDKRPEWTSDDQRTTMAIMVEGNFRIDLSAASITLTKQGDYLVWGPGIDHCWEALADSVVVTVRWPSSPSGPASR